MPDTLPPPARRRLGLILARLSSDHDGEALNAARLACRILAEHGLRPEALAGLVGEAPRQDPPRRDPPRQDRRADRNAEPEVEPIDDATEFADALLHDPFAAQVLSAKEFDFLNDLAGRAYDGPASAKQAKWMRDIEARLARRRRRA